ncbi:MAG: hypothetical protein GY793_00885 [Proteobacteria bacterium]|nr:hypothetical protein [Pseudomonadota bacterium]
MMRNFFKYQIIAMSFLLLTFVAEAQNLSVDVTFDGDELILTSPQIIKNVVFKRFNDVWIIFSERNLSVNIDEKTLKGFGITEIEKLLTKNGVGLRIGFKKDSSPEIYLSENIVNRTSSIHLNRKALKEQTPNRIKFRIEKEKQNLRKLFLDSSFVLDYAYSSQTGEQYLVAISNDTRLRYLSKQLYKDLFFLPTYSGAVLIAADGSFLNIEDEYIVKISKERDDFFYKESTNGLVKSLSNFFNNNGVGILEKQNRTYDFDFSRFKPTGDYTKTITRLDNTLKNVEELDIVSYLESDEIDKTDFISNTNNRMVERALISEENVIGNEPTEEVKRVPKLKNQKKVSGEVLVPSFSEYKTNFLLNKLLLSSIKQLSSSKKDNVTIKRMQIEAFRGFYPEVLGLSKLLRQDVSGRFPNITKGRALYTLASAMMGRCKDVSLMPNSKGVFLSDIKLWKAYCLTETRDFSKAMSLYKENFERINTYPQNLKTPLLINYAKTLRALDQYHKSNEILSKLLQKSNKEYVAKVKHQIALNHLYQNESKMAEKEFKELVFDKRPEVKYPARLEYLGILLQKGATEKDIIIDALEDLRFDFRDNKTELESTRMLASLYLQEDHLRKAMDLYKYISIYYNNVPQGKEATEILFNIFYNLFVKKQKTNKNLSEVGKLAIFYDFIELTPSEFETSSLILNVAEDLVKLGLNNKAIELLTVQLKYKTKDKNVAKKLGEELAALYLNTSQLKNALQILSVTQITDNYTRKAKIIKAKVLLKQGNINEAEKVLKTIKDDVVAKYILSNIYWERGEYKKISEELKDLFLKEKTDLDKDGVINLSYLMLSSAVLKDVDTLEKIKEFYLPILKIVNLDHKINFLIKVAGKSVEINPSDRKKVDLWQKVLKVDNEINNFLQKYKLRRSQ